MKMGAAWIIGIVFVILKLAGITKIAAWSWWWVLCPFWAWAIVVVIYFSVAEGRKR